MRFLRALAWMAAFSAASAFAQSASRSDGSWFVPWHVLNPGYVERPAEIVVYWLPESREEVRRAELATSRELTRLAGPCVALLIVRPDDADRLAGLGGGERRPLVVITDGDGRPLRRIVASRGGVPASAVVTSLRDEIAARERIAEGQLERARSLAAAGDGDGAAALYRLVAGAACLLPRQSRMAERALRKLDARK